MYSDVHRGTGQPMGGTPPYMAPEVRARSPLVSLQADVWSAGVVAFEALTGSHNGVTADDVAAAGSAWTLPVLPEGTDADFAALLHMMLTVNPDVRPSSSDLLAHPSMVRQRVAEDMTRPAPGGDVTAPSAAALVDSRQPRIDAQLDAHVAALFTGHPSANYRGDPTMQRLTADGLLKKLNDAHRSGTFASLASPFDDCMFEAPSLPPIPLRLRQLRRTAPTARPGTDEFIPIGGETPLSVLLGEDRVHVVSGVAGSGKTWLTRHIAHCHATSRRYDENDPRSSSFSGVKRVIVLRMRDLLPCDYDGSRWPTLAHGIARFVSRSYDIDVNEYDSESDIC